jgi:hypothetical protein
MKRKRVPSLVDIFILIIVTSPILVFINLPRILDFLLLPLDKMENPIQIYLQPNWSIEFIKAAVLIGLCVAVTIILSILLIKSLWITMQKITSYKYYRFISVAVILFLLLGFVFTYKILIPSLFKGTKYIGQNEIEMMAYLFTVFKIMMLTFLGFNISLILFTINPYSFKANLMRQTIFILIIAIILFYFDYKLITIYSVISVVFNVIILLLLHYTLRSEFRYHLTS